MPSIHQFWKLQYEKRSDIWNHLQTYSMNMQSEITCDHTGNPLGVKSCPRCKYFNGWHGVSSEVCISISGGYLYNQIDEVDSVSTMSLKRCVSVSVVQLAFGGSATNVATPFIYLFSINFFL